MNAALVVLTAWATLSAPAGTADGLLANEAGTVGAGLEPLHHTRTDWNPDQITFVFQTREGARVVVGLTHPESGLGEPIAGRYRAQVAVEPASARAQVAAAVDRLMARLTTRARLGPELRVPRAPPPGAAGAGSSARAPASHHQAAATVRSATLELWLCWALLLFGLATLPWLVRATGRGLAGGQERIAGALWAWAAVIVVQLLFVPQTLVGVFSGYASVVDAHALVPVAKYGAYTTALYGPVLRLLGPSTDVIVAVNQVLGLALLPLAGAWAARLSGTARAGWLAVLIVGLAPALLRDRGSESVLVPIQWAILAAGVHFDRWLEDGGRAHGVGACAWAALALHGRPEAWLIVPLLAMAWSWRATRFHRLRGGAQALVGLGLVAVIAPRAWSLWHYLQSAAGRGDVPGLEGGGDVAGMWERFQSLNLLLSPHLHAVTLTVAALFAAVVVRRAHLAAVASILGVAIVWVALSTLDLPEVSVPRVQAPALLLIAILGSVTVANLAQGPERWRRGLAVLVLLLSVVPQGQVLDSLWGETNAQRFDQFWRRAKAVLPDDGGETCAVALSMSDPPPDVVLRHLPLYEIPGLGPEGASLSISTFLETPATVLASGCDPIYVEGPQCYARSFDPAGDPPERAERLPICTRMHREWALEPLHVEDIPNAGNRDFSVYGASPDLRYGLYRIVHLDPTNTGPRKVVP